MSRPDTSLRIQSPLAGSLRTRRNAYRLLRAIEVACDAFFIGLFAIGVGAFIAAAYPIVLGWF